ncbi:MAG: bifunctional 4-hydroxy-2-oxoglutarate aldolase/2-dehydro-3-deoxy-phosphogluconate aldolase [Actinomyces urogenitalis]|uniref:bifunctional 4-hydroxy-2-oxoglutarate aldolase/2-dehydro-3-deoxy-phosphogluconate aldolase n=1 Tax=Actinomyces urogenitalis TaxID=103621 RepID=UPI002A7FC5E9|nr:bifunctional 4-hydroxy-2-oxoglutarate aldolase/2-dehydro-3-deoxy-phosphogluconate aldolase [Actinomyces urogenitalis]MDY3679354.1 bifunctional 4-hydroxy-2-oxoglutarate aldolase/2-dehydro-3-deoxy-phosphogluconate aldolase [Actinomyces urogenitalis]
MSLQDLLSANPVVPVVVVDSAQEGVGVGRALVAGGITTAEVTFRTAAAADAIRAMSEIEGLTVGAGTVVNPAQVEAAVAAGAQYIVSPGLSAEVVRATQEAGVISLPACTDGSWIMAALALGLDTVKFFPAEASGGIATIKALSAAFPGLRFMPTGGVSAANLADYLSVPVVAACGGSWMVKKDLVKAGAWEEITRLSAEAVAIAKECGR